jgi:hypothetical protein
MSADMRVIVRAIARRTQGGSHGHGGALFY